MIEEMTNEGWLDSIPSPEPITNLFLSRSAKSADRIANHSKIEGRWVGTTWREARLAIEETALGLLELGAEAGTPIAILSQTRREWTQIDLATLSIGGITVGLYPSLTKGQVRQLLELSGARIAFCDDRSQRVKLQEAADGLDGAPLVVVTMEQRPDTENVVRFGTEDLVEPRSAVITLAEMRRRGAKRRVARPDEFVRRCGERKSTDVVSYIYTSGTTGEPKGAMLTHANFHYVTHATCTLIPYANQRAIAFLPLAHSLQRYASYLALIVDVEAYFAESIEKLPENLQEVRPNTLAAVPRILEKIHARAMAAADRAPDWGKRLFESSIGALHEVGSIRRDGRVPGLRSRIRAKVADELVAKRVRDKLGGRVKFIGCGGAPLSSEVHAFFEDIGIPVLEGWGLTETSAPVCINTLETRRMGTVGRPLPGTFVRIAEDGEILVRGPGVFSGYHQNPAATEDAFDGDGWFKTGDLGVMSRDGFLSITGRKKDLIITSAGKNVAPQPLEDALRSDPLISQAVVIGDRRPYLTALLTLDNEMKDQVCQRFGLGATQDAEALAALPEIRARIEAHVAHINAERAPFEQIRTFKVLPQELTIEAGELTPTLKVKRRVVTDRYSGQIDAMYR